MEWISVKDRLPEKENYYVLSIKNLNDGTIRVRTGYFYKTNKENWFRIYPMNWNELFKSKERYICDDLEGDKTQATHWMLIPKPPKDL